MGKKPPLKNIPAALLHPDEMGVWVGQRLAQHRLAANLTREQLSRLAGVAPETVKVIETRGRSSLETLLRLIVALGLQDRLEILLTLPESRSLVELAEREKLRVRKRARAKKST